MSEMRPQRAVPYLSAPDVVQAGLILEDIFGDSDMRVPETLGRLIGAGLLASPARKQTTAADPPAPDPECSDLVGALREITFRTALHARDFGAHPTDAWIYGITVGWGCEDEHIHDPVCGGDSVPDVAARWGWTRLQIEQLRRHRAAYRRVTETPAAGRP